MNNTAKDDEKYINELKFKEALTGSLPGDSPLLYELGIDFDLIKSESLLSVKALSRNNIPIVNPSDVTGPFVLIALFALSLVLHGKIHFGYVYLISLSSCMFLYFLNKLISTENVRFAVCCSILGYSFVPVFVFSFVDLAIRWTGLVVRLVLGLLSALWSTYAAATLFSRYLKLSDKTLVVGYPLFLTYISCVLLVVF